MAKRKREETAKEPRASAQPSKAVKPATATPKASASSTADTSALTLQIITGSYDRILHGFTAGVSSDGFLSTESKDSAAKPIQFTDTFLFEAHSSAIRCLALSPLSKTESTDEAQRVTLATGGTDERINLYSLSMAPPAVNDQFPSIPTLSGNKILENPKNRELGSLVHHSASISALYFPSRSKLLTASEDNTISIAKTRDFTVVSTIKAPHPKVQGRPSGDTAPPGGSPSGVNDFAVHPSMKLMLSVGKGEKCMRLWNLVTGKKAGVLNFTREMLQGVKEGKWSTGEGRKIAWNTKGDEFAVVFEWGAIVFGIDSIPVCRVMPSPRSKLHQIKYVPLDPSVEDSEELLAVSTEDGRVIFYSTKKTQPAENDPDCSIPLAESVAQLGGRANGFSGRVKDFEILSLRDQPSLPKDDFLVVTGNSEGIVRVWLLRGEELVAKKTNKKSSKKSKKEDEKSSTVAQVGKFLSEVKTDNRITCLKAFVMLPPEDPSTLQVPEDDSEEEEESDDDSESEESDEE